MLTGDVGLLPKLFDRVLSPQAVRDELADPEAPAVVRAWIAQAPAWLDVQLNPDASDRDDGTAPKLDRGERAVIALALAVKADFVLMDDQAGVTVARQKASPQPARWACSIWRPGAGWSISPRLSSA